MISTSNVIVRAVIKFTGLINDQPEDTGKRANFTNIQMSQTEPVENNQPSRVRTSYEKIVPHLSKPPFVYMAEDDGRVLDIDENVNLIKIEYNSGKRICVEFGKLMSRYSAAGMFITQSVVVHSKVKHNRTFKKNEPIVFNDDFFMEDPFSNQVIWMLGYRAKVAIMDTDGTIDDSNMISKKLGEKLKFHPIHDRQIVLSRDFTIHSFVEIGTKVNSTTPLLIFEEHDDSAFFDSSIYDEETLNLIKKLNRKTPKAKTNGVITDIQVTYTSPLNTMSESMQKFIKHIEKRHNRKVTFSNDTHKPIPPNTPITGTDKIGLVDLTEETVIITYYIQDSYGVKQADKTIFGSALKSTTSFVFKDEITTENGEIEVEAFFSGLSIYNRMTPENITVGTASMVLDKLQKEVLKLYFD